MEGDKIAVFDGSTLLPTGNRGKNLKGCSFRPAPGLARKRVGHSTPFQPDVPEDFSKTYKTFLVKEFLKA